MQLSIVQLVWVVNLAGACYALASSHNRMHVHRSSSLSVRAVSPDNTCGGANGFTCDPNAANGGECCSPSGYCGKTAAYCGTGCQPAFGVCNSVESTTPVFSEFECGPTHGNQKCQNNLCCSTNGYCGSTEDYCGTGCQPLFGGQCLSKTGTAKCGNLFGGAACPSGQCCNPEGNCGTEQYDCRDPDCQYQFGRCDSDTTPIGIPTASDPRPRLGQVTYDNDIYSCTKANVVALTYDDGPYLYTSTLLDLLKQYGFTATFFVTGNNLGKGEVDTTAPWPDLLRRMINEGHQIASHTWSHYSLNVITADMRIAQMVKNERAIANVIGKYPTYMRPPYSQCSDASGCNADMNALGYHRIYFDLDTQDTINYLPTTIYKSKEVVDTLLGQSTVPNRLSVQHDLVEPSVSQLSPYLFDVIKSKGWKGVSAGECLEDPAANWYRVPGTGGAAGGSSTASTQTSQISSTTLKTSSTTPKTSSTTLKTSSTTLKTSSTKATTTKVSTTTTTTPKATSTTVKNASTTPKVSVTSTSTSATATPTAVKRSDPCALNPTSGTCGAWKRFHEEKGCLESLANCQSEAEKCTSQTGKTRCQNVCKKLDKFCQTCGSNCRSAVFAALNR